MIAASYAEENQARGRHGIPLAEAMDAANQFAYEAVGPREDFAQSAINKAEDAFEKVRPKGDTRAISFGVRLREP